MTVTMGDVAKLAGVSIKSVSNFFNDYPHMTDSTRQRIAEAVNQLDYRMNVSARNLRSGRTGSIMLALAELDQAYLSEFTHAVIRIAEEFGLAVVVETTGGHFDLSTFPIGDETLSAKEIIGNDIRTELIVDGIDPALVEGEVAGAELFRDVPEPSKTPTACADDSACGKDMYCGKPYQGGPGKVCRDYVPVLASPHMLEIYNGSLRRAYNLPRLNPDFLVGVSLEMRVGASMVQAAEKDQLLYDRLKLVGFSDKAVPLGVTMPLSQVARYNVHFGTPEAATRYHSIIVKIEGKDQVAAVAKKIEELGFEVTDGGAEQAGFLISVFVLVFSLLSTIIVGIAAVNIMHVFFMLVYERQREIGIMRAVGARRSDIQRIILGEAASVGLVAGAIGVGLAYGASRVFDYVSARHLPDFPYKPETYFAFSFDLVALALGFAAGFCVLGAWLPARRAARMDPAAVLTGR